MDSRDCRPHFFLALGLAVAALAGLLCLWTRQKADISLQDALVDNLYSTSAHHGQELADLEILVQRLYANDEELVSFCRSIWQEVQGARTRIEALEGTISSLPTRDTTEGLEGRLGAVESVLRPMLPPPCGFAVPIFGTQVQEVTVYGEDRTTILMPTTKEEREVDLGTGFVLEWSGRSILVTAGHLFSEEKQEAEGFLIGPDGLPQKAILVGTSRITAQWFVWKGEKVAIDLKRSTVDPKDCAVGEFDQRAYDGPTGLCGEMPPEGSPLWVATNRPDLRAGEVKVPGVYAGRKGGSTTEAYTHIAALPVWFGYSGSPVLYDGKVVGIVLHLYPGSVLGFCPLSDALEGF